MKKMFLVPFVKQLKSRKEVLDVVRLSISVQNVINGFKSTGVKERPVLLV